MFGGVHRAMQDDDGSSSMVRVRLPTSASTGAAIVAEPIGDGTAPYRCWLDRDYSVQVDLHLEGFRSPQAGAMCLQTACDDKGCADELYFSAELDEKSRVWVLYCSERPIPHWLTAARGWSLYKSKAGFVVEQPHAFVDAYVRDCLPGKVDFGGNCARDAFTYWVVVVPAPSDEEQNDTGTSKLAHEPRLPAEPEPEPEPQPQPQPQPQSGSGPQPETVRAEQVAPPQSRGEAEQTKGPVSVAFTQPGTLGINLVAADSRPDRLCISRVYAGTQADEHPQLCPGLLLATVADTPVRQTEYAAILELVQSSARPLTISFDRPA
jgi:hypothetical protein